MSEWSVDPKKFLAVLAILDMVPLRPGIPSAVFIEFAERKGTMTMSLSSDVSGVVSVKGEGTLDRKKPVYLDRRLFLPFVYTAKTYKSDKPFVFSISEKQVLVHQGKRKASFDQMLGGSGYGEIDESTGSVLPLDKKLTEILIVANECASPDPTVPELNCVYTLRNVKGIDVYSSNQLVVFKGMQKINGKFPEKLPFPLYLVPFLKADGIKEVRLKSKEVVLTFDCGHIWQAVSAKALKSFPATTIDKLIKDGGEWEEKFRLQTKRLGSVARRFSEYLTSVRRQDWMMFVDGQAGSKQVLLEVKIAQGVFRERVTVEEPIVKPFRVDWPLDHLLPVIEHMSKDKDGMLTVRFDKKTPYLLSTKGLSVVLTRKV